MEDALDLGSSGVIPWGFKSPSSHMEYTLMKKSEWLIGIEAKINGEEVLKREEEIAKKYKRHAEIPGFRKGKAPLEMVRKKFEKDIEADVVESFANEVYKRFLSEDKYKPVSPAKISYWNFLENRELRFEIEVEVEPELQLPEYKNIKVSKELKFKMEEEIEKRLKTLAEKNATFVKSNKPAQKGDYLLVDYSVYDSKGRKISKQENVLVECGDPENFVEINQVLEGAKSGEIKLCEIEYPEDYPDVSLRNKKFQYKFFIKEVKEKRIPKIDDELANTVGYENLQALKKAIEEEIHKEKEAIIERNIEEQIINHLLQNTHVSLPPSEVEEEYRYLLLKYGLQDTEEIRKKLIQRAEDTVKIRLILKKIAEKEKITASEEEIEKEIEKKAKQHGVSVERAKTLWRKDSIKEEIIAKKVIEFLKQNAIVEGGIVVYPNSY